MKWLASLLVASIALAASTKVTAQVAHKPALTLEGAKQVLAAAIDEAKRLNATGAFAVVDEGGNLMAVERLDGTFAAAANISIGKARTAAIFKRPTRTFEEIIRDGRTPMIALDDFTPLQGGVPIVVDGEVVGAIGVSGASSAAQDEELAVLGAAAITTAGVSMSAMSEAGGVTHIANDEVDDAFAVGMPLIENDEFKIHASRREKPGQAEVHTDETDIIYVLEGSATFVTGGCVEGGMEIEPNEIRGPSIDGGSEQSLQPGDVIVVPAGTPHWFKEVEGPLLYYVVKVIS